MIGAYGRVLAMEVGAVADGKLFAFTNLASCVVRHTRAAITVPAKTELVVQWSEIWHRGTSWLINQRHLVWSVRRQVAVIICWVNYMRRVHRIAISFKFRVPFDGTLAGAAQGASVASRQLSNAQSFATTNEDAAQPLVT
eukprot:CAMPEP_0119343098 /NCGR_PEP_ID=MMETSP1333-20130426/106134_1 /TAXON_ID=418940 /ORGANISM="Scyphosphaera apsteinii, Strain RCC1455" /LENGTH=139 /DNA_ID=CAMNT_0007355453 /DNA_START=32 /DNA_END=451 /DNA_ORIENTATION=-